jgi:TRAP-type uncharacterized transport system fused permease subunit
MVGENWLKVALTAMALGVGLYVIPLGMIANPGLLRMTEAPLDAGVAFLRMGIGLSMLSFGLISARSAAIRLVLAIAGLLVIFWPVGWGPFA